MLKNTGTRANLVPEVVNKYMINCQEIVPTLTKGIVVFLPLKKGLLSILKSKNLLQFLRFKILPCSWIAEAVQLYKVQFN